MPNIRNSLAVALITVLCLSGSIARSADPRPDAKNDGPAIGEVRTQKLAGFTYFHGTMHVSLLTFPFKLAALLPDLHKAMDSVHAKPTGPMVLIYHGPMDDATATVDVEIGFPVAEKTPAAGDFKVSEIPAHDCMSVLYTGPLGGIAAAYEKLIPAAEDTTHQTDETRLMFLYSEGAESVNNVIHVSVGVKP